MDGDGTTNILFLLSQAETSSILLRHLPAGELINLARTNSAIRGELHGFEEPHASSATVIPEVRHELQIGHHQTARWKQLKANAPYKCSSSTHTKGTDVKPCRYCSRLICSACMVRASFANPGEQTFKNRCRSYCESCWASGIRHKQQKITDDCECHHDTGQEKPETKQDLIEVTKTCECTNTKDGWVCLECKHLQNVVWRDGLCFGEGCTNPLDEAAERRKICMWCDKPLPITATRENPHVYKQKVVDALAREAAIRQADAEAHAQRRQKRLKMTRRELRGSEGIFDDIPQFVRSLDTVNYTQLIGHDHVVPTSQQVYLSKQGKWEYNIGFLLTFRNYCTAIPVPPSVREATKHNKVPRERTNQEVYEETQRRKRKLIGRSSSPNAQSEDFKGHVMSMSYVEGWSLNDIQATMFKEFGIWKTVDRYEQLIREWKEEAELKASRTRIAPQDRSAYWKVLNPSTGIFDNNPTDPRGDSVPQRDSQQPTLKDGLLENQESRHRRQSSSATIAHHLPMEPLSTYQPALYRSPSLNIRQALASGTLFPSGVDVHTGASNISTMDDSGDTFHFPGRRQTLPNPRDLSAREVALHDALPEELNDLLATEEAVRGDVEAELEQDSQAEDEALREGNARPNPHLDHLIAAQEAWREQNGEEFDEYTGPEDLDEEDLNLLIALQESTMQAAETARNESRPDGRPPVYFA